jgi:hypothetical protein
MPPPIYLNSIMVHFLCFFYKKHPSTQAKVILGPCGWNQVYVDAKLSMQMEDLHLGRPNRVCVDTKPSAQTDSHAQGHVWMQGGGGFASHQGGKSIISFPITNNKAWPHIPSLAYLTYSW